MRINTKMALPLLALSVVSSATPLEKREAAPGPIEDLLKGILTPIGQLIKDVLAGAKSAIDDTRSNKPATCSLPLLSRDKCCACESSGVG
jgi:L-ascorbate peroxidase